MSEAPKLLQSPGSIIIGVVLVFLALSSDFRNDIKNLWHSIDNIDSTKFAATVGVLVIMLTTLAYLLSQLVHRVWEFFLYFFMGGHDHPNYESARLALKKELPADSKHLAFINKMPIQSLYGLLLHTYGSDAYRRWLTRRWDSVAAAGTQSIALVFSSTFVATIHFVLYRHIDLRVMLACFAIGIVFPTMGFFVARKRMREALFSEELFCKSLGDETLSKAIGAVASRMPNSDANIDVSDRSVVERGSA